MRVLVAVDKMRGTMTASEVADALTRAFRARPDVSCTGVALSDGGEGFLDALGGQTQSATVTSASGEPVAVPWSLKDTVAIIETGLVIGHQPGVEPNPARALAATSVGVGELITIALENGATTIVVGLGGSTTTDGGMGALRALGAHTPFAAGIDVQVAADVSSRFPDAARLFGRQKGADDAALAILDERLRDAAAQLLATFGRDVTREDGTGAAGGLAGALWAAGGRLLGGFDLVAEHIGLDALIADADLVVTAEGRFDQTSLAGKVTGAVLARCRKAGVPCAVVAGQSDLAAEDVGVRVIDLVETFGSGAALADTAACLDLVPALIVG